jgi:hypothetical protein
LDVGSRRSQNRQDGVERFSLFRVFCAVGNTLAIVTIEPGLVPVVAVIYGLIGRRDYAYCHQRLIVREWRPP